MARHQTMVSSLVRRLWPSPERFAAAAALRERDLGELREGGRLTVPVLAGLAGMVASAAVYVALTAGSGGGAVGGWGVAISTDTALALGALTIAAGQSAHHLRVFMITLLVVDDVAALLVISFVYPSRLDPAAVIVAALAPLRRRHSVARVRRGYRPVATTPCTAQ
jgi:Na+/H+ antiporter NhaA